MSKDGCENDNRREFTQLGAVLLRCVFSAQLLTIWLFHLNFFFRTILPFGRNSALSIIDPKLFRFITSIVRVRFHSISNDVRSVRPSAGHAMGWPAGHGLRASSVLFASLSANSDAKVGRCPQGQACKIVHTTTCTVNVCRMSHRKQREIKQQLIRWPDLALLGCSLLSLHILCDILQTFTVRI